MLAPGQSSDLLKELLNTTHGGGLDGWSQRGGAWLGEQQLGADAENASELGDGTGAWRSSRALPVGNGLLFFADGLREIGLAEASILPESGEPRPVTSSGFGELSTHTRSVRAGFFKLGGWRTAGLHDYKIVCNKRSRQQQ